MYRHGKRFRTRFNAVKAVSIREVMHGNVLVLTVSRVLWSMSESVVRAYLSLYILALGGSATIIGLINSIGSLSASLLYPIGGYIADKAGRAKLVGVATILYITSFLVLASAPSWEWVALGSSISRWSFSTCLRSTQSWLIPYLEVHGAEYTLLLSPFRRPFG